MLRSVFVIATLAACHPAPAPTVVRATPVVAVPAPGATPVRQDFDVGEAVQPGPLHEVLATGHECKQEPGPIDEPVTGRPLLITATATPAECGPVADRHRPLDVPWAASHVEMRAPPR